MMNIGEIMQLAADNGIQIIGYITVQDVVTDIKKRKHDAGLDDGALLDHAKDILPELADGMRDGYMSENFWNDLADVMTDYHLYPDAGKEEIYDGNEIDIDYVLDNLDPCEPGAKWLATQPDLATAWQNCQQPNWMLWLCGQLNLITDAQQNFVIQLTALETPLPDGRRVIDMITHPDILAFIELKRLRSAGVDVDKIQWHSSSETAWNALNHIAEPERTASQAATFTYPSATMRLAAQAVAEVSALGDDGWHATLAWQADRIREIVGNPFKES